MSFSEGHVSFYLPPPHPQFHVVDMIPMLRTCGCRIMSTLNWGRGGGVYNKNCEHLNESRRARVSCLQNFNVSQQVLSKIVVSFVPYVNTVWYSSDKMF